MNIIQQFCSEPAGWAAIAGWALYAISEAVGANPKLRENTALEFGLHVLQAVLPVEVEVKKKSKSRPGRRRTTRPRTAEDRFSSARDIIDPPD